MGRIEGKQKVINHVSLINEEFAPAFLHVVPEWEEMQRWDSPVPAMGSLPMVGEMNPDRDHHTGSFGD